MNLEGDIIQPITAPPPDTTANNWFDLFEFFFFFYLRKLKIVPKPSIMSIKRLCGFLYNLTVLAPVRDNKTPSFCHPSLCHASTFSDICPPPIVSGKENLLCALKCSRVLARKDKFLPFLSFGRDRQKLIRTMNKIQGFYMMKDREEQ